MNDLLAEPRSFSRAILRAPPNRLLFAAAAAGLVLLAAAPGALVRVWSALFAVAFLGVALSLAGPVLLALAAVCGARWHRTIELLPRALAAGVLPWGLICWLLLAARVALGLGSLEAATAAAAGHGGTLWFKVWWLEPQFLLARGAFYVACWWGLSRALVAPRASAARENAARGAGNAQLQKRLVARAALFLPLFAMSFSLACADWLMSLEPMWYSTAWGVYQFAGLMTLGLAAMILLGLSLRRTSPQACPLTDDQLHDLAKLLLGFCCFWMYLWYCQYMLIWYANIPEESVYFTARIRGAWGPVFYANVLMNWALPFLVLLPRAGKRSPRVLARVCVAVLLGRGVDLYTAIYPATLGQGAPFGLIELAGAAGATALAAHFMLRAARRSQG
jgi:hypothetical protein